MVAATRATDITAVALTRAERELLVKLVRKHVHASDEPLAHDVLAMLEGAVSVGLFEFLKPQA